VAPSINNEILNSMPSIPRIATLIVSDWVIGRFTDKMKANRQSVTYLMDRRRTAHELANSAFEPLKCALGKTVVLLNVKLMDCRWTARELAKYAFEPLKWAVCEPIHGHSRRGCVPINGLSTDSQWMGIHPRFNVRADIVYA